MSSPPGAWGDVAPAKRPLFWNWGLKGPFKRLPGGASHRHAAPGACSQSSLLSHRNLSAIQDREICCYSISCKEKDNIGEYHGLQRGARHAAAWGQAMPEGAACPGCSPRHRRGWRPEAEAVGVPLPSQTSPYSGLSSTRSLGEAEIPRTAAWIGKMPLYKPMPLLSPALSLQLSL